MFLHAYFMVGIPYEREEDISQTIQFMREMPLDSINLCTFTPFPGTKLYDYVTEKGLLVVDEDYRVFDTIGMQSDVHCLTPEIPLSRYQELLKEAMRVSTEITNRFTWKKVIWRIRHLTWKGVLRALRYRLRTIFSHYR